MISAQRDLSHSQTALIMKHSDMNVLKHIKDLI